MEINDSDQRVRVELGPRSYTIRIGNGCLSAAGQQLAAWLAANPSTRLRIMLVADQAVVASHAATVISGLRTVGADVQHVTIPSGEQSKSFEQAQRLYDALVDSAADRRTVVVAVGGGVVGDLAGFVAATYARGLRFIQIPTTLLSMVDSSVGGKTGINHPRGKNLIGAFHQPSGVLIDTATLLSLSLRDFRSGLAEVVKYGVILDPDFFVWLENAADQLLARDPAALRHVIARSCQLKAQVVSQDEFETSGLRAILNYGHTFAHAFESLAGYGTLLHGEAVSIGMVCASRLAERLNRISPDVTQRQIALLQRLGLPVDTPQDLISQPEAITRCMLLDKKTQDGKLRFILPSALGHVETVHDIPATLALSALR